MKFKAFGAEIRVSFLFTATLTLLTVTSIKQAVFISFFSALFHETGHISAVQKFGGKIKSVELGAFGGRITLGEELSFSPAEDALIAFSGPLVNIILSLISALFYLTAKNDFFSMAAGINFGMAFFNLLPVSSLDGGRIFSYFCGKNLSDKSAGVVTSAVSFAFLSLILFLGFFLIIREGGNFSLLITCSYLLMLSFIRALD